MVKYAEPLNAVSRQTAGTSLSPARPTLASIEERSPLLSARWFGQLDQLHIPADTVLTHWTTRLPIRPIRFSTTGHAFDQVIYGVSDEAGQVADVIGKIGNAFAMVG